MLMYNTERAADMLKYIKVRWPSEEMLKDAQSENENIACIINGKDPFLIIFCFMFTILHTLQHCSV